MISDLLLCRTSHFSKVLSQYCRVVKTYNANVCCNSRAGTNKCKQKQYLSVAHISLTILQMFLVFVILVNVV